VTAIKFSHDSKFFAVANGHKIRIFQSPALKKTFAPLVLHKRIHNLHSDDVISIQWSHDSRFLLTSSVDLTLVVFSLHDLPGFQPFTFKGNRHQIVNAFFSEGQK
jgi:periodic tryptophan protein 2